MSIKTIIVDAFKDSAYPGDDQLTVYDPGGRDYDVTFHLLRGKSWEEMPVGEFLAGDTPISDLTAKAFHYYLPALLIASIQDYTDFSITIADALLFHLSPESACATGEFAYDHTQSYNERISLLTPKNKNAIILVIDEYLRRGWAGNLEVDKTIARIKEETPR